LTASPAPCNESTKGSFILANCNLNLYQGSNRAEQMTGEEGVSVKKISRLLHEEETTLVMRPVAMQHHRRISTQRPIPIVAKTSSN